MKKLLRTFSRVFPSYHPRVGEDTFFVEQILNWYWDKPYNGYHNVYEMLRELNPAEKWSNHQLQEFQDSLNPDITDWKGHTIRAGHYFKAGDYLQPCVWSGKPYNSKQIQFAPDIKIEKVWDIDIAGTDWFLSGRHEYALTGDGFDRSIVANNDGLTPSDFYDWFTLSPDFRKKQEFSGQIICWNAAIEY